MKKFALPFLIFTLAASGCGDPLSTLPQGGQPVTAAAAPLTPRLAALVQSRSHPGVHSAKTAGNIHKEQWMTGALASPPPANSVRLQLRPAAPATEAPVADLPPGEITWDLPLYPGAESVSLPEPLPKHIWVSPYLKAASAQYSLPTSAVEAEKWYREHLAASDFQLQASGSSGQQGVTTSRNITYSPHGGDSRRIELTFQATGSDHTVVQYWASTIDTPPRAAGSYLPSNIVKVEVTYRPWRWNPPTLNRVLTDPKGIAQLVAAVNALSRDTRGTHHCPNDLGQGGGLVFVLGNGGFHHVSLQPSCGSTFVDEYPSLVGNQAWDALVAIMEASS